jgi:para-nitrobenzyl esterase
MKCTNAETRSASLLIGLCALALAAASTHGVQAADRPVPVTIENFPRAESDHYFGQTVQEDGFGTLHHRRDMASIDEQDVVRMNRDTIYSSGVFDLDAGPLMVTLPDAGARFMSMLFVSEDHYAVDVAYAPGKHSYTADKVGTRYVFVVIRTLANPGDPEDMKAAHALQDAIKVEQGSIGKWEQPQWDPIAQKKIRDALAVLGSAMGNGPRYMFGTKSAVNPIHHLIGTAIGWGGNPPSAAVYMSFYPRQNDGQTAYELTVKEVPVDGFWSISVYNAAGYFEKNDRNAYSLNNLTARPNADGSFTIHFGGAQQASNYLAIMPGWNYTVRLYRPRSQVLDGTWTFPEAQPVR